MAPLGHSLPMHSVSVSNNGRYASDSDHLWHKSELTLSAGRVTLRCSERVRNSVRLELEAVKHWPRPTAHFCATGYWLRDPIEKFAFFGGHRGDLRVRNIGPQIARMVSRSLSLALRDHTPMNPLVDVLLGGVLRIPQIAVMDGDWRQNLAVMWPEMIKRPALGRIYDNAGDVGCVLAFTASPSNSSPVSA
jgi:hypothetical protein